MSTDIQNQETLGPYKLLEQISQYGPRLVYLAEQSGPVRRAVVIEIVQGGSAEQPAPVRLDHPNLARTLDAGTTPEGWPYSVVELVKGAPLTAWSDQHRLSLSGRLEMFLSVCAAVQYAHQNGVVHGHLTPANVLVVDSAPPTPKVIGFGRGKLGRHPESGNGKLDPGGDVHGLGVLLYELLTGATPAKAGQEAILPPSKRVGEPADRLATVASGRQTEPAALVAALGELDGVVMKALEKDPARRYPNVAELARDVQQHLDANPAATTPATQADHAHQPPRKKPVALVALLVAAVGSVGLAGLSWRDKQSALAAAQHAREESEQAKKAAEEVKAKQKAEQAKEKAELALAFLRDRVLAAGRSNKEITLRTALDGAEGAISREFGERPLVEAMVREVWGEFYQDLGRLKRAVEQFERALVLWEALSGPDHESTVACRKKLAAAYRLADRPDEASILYDPQSEMLPRAMFLERQGAVLLAHNKPAEAEQKLRDCLAIREKKQPKDAATFEAKSLLGEALLKQKKYAAAEPLLLAGAKGLTEHLAQAAAEQGFSWLWLASRKGFALEEARERAIERLVRLYEDQEKKDSAARWRKELQLVEGDGKP
jgi:hypothetical protein